MFLVFVFLLGFILICYFKENWRKGLFVLLGILVAFFLINLSWEALKERATDALKSSADNFIERLLNTGSEETEE